MQMSRLLLSLLLLICFTAQATTVPSVGLEELVDQSEIIVHGRVVQSWATWDGAHKYIWTHHLIAVIDGVRGSGAGYVVASEPGGQLGNVGMRFSGALDYGVGEETVVFLYRTPIGFLRATGYGQGKYTVTQEARVRANSNGLDLLPRKGLRGAELSTLNGLTVDDFKARVRDAIRRGR